MRYFKLGTVALSVLLVAGGAVAQEPGAPAPAPGPFNHAQGLTMRTAADTSPWWQALGDPVLSQLVQQGLGANLDLAQAAQRVLRSRALAGASHAAMGPAGSASLQNRSVQMSEAEAPGLARSARRGDTLRLGLDLSWEIDLFGRLGAQAGAADQRVRASQAQAQALRLAVSAEIAQAYFALVGAREQLQLSLHIAQNRRDTVDLVARRAAAGLASPMDDARARSDLAAALADAPAHEAAAAVATHRLAVLLGESPSQFVLPVVQALDPAAVTITIPESARWLAGRADLQELEATLQAQALDVKAVRAELFPRLSFSGALGFLAGSATAFGTGGAAAWLAAPTLSVPLLDRPRIEARLQAARAQQREALAAYQQRVLLAVEEVENALVRYRQGQVQFSTLQEHTRHAVTAERLARVRYEAGASDLLELLDAQRAARQSQAALAQALAAQRQHLVTAFKALGAESV